MLRIESTPETLTIVSESGDIVLLCTPDGTDTDVGQLAEMVRRDNAHDRLQKLAALVQKPDGSPGLLIEALIMFCDDDQCVFDYHGNCETHACLNGAIKRLLTKAERIMKGKSK